MKKNVLPLGITDATTIERIGKLDESLSFYKSMDHKIIK